MTGSQNGHKPPAGSGKETKNHPGFLSAEITGHLQKSMADMKSLRSSFLPAKISLLETD